MRFFSDEVLVLSKKFTSGNDISVCFMSRSRGVFWAVAKNGRKSRRRFVNSFEQPAVLYGYFRGNPMSGRSLIVEKVEIIETFQNIKSDLIKTLASWYMLSLSKDISVTGESYELTLKALFDLGESCSHYEVLAVALGYTYNLVIEEGFNIKLIEGDDERAKHIIAKLRHGERKEFKIEEILIAKDFIKRLIANMYGENPKFTFILDELSDQLTQEKVSNIEINVPW